LVVQAFEVIKVNEDQGERSAMAVRAFKFFRQAFSKMAIVGNPRFMVSDQLALKGRCSGPCGLHEMVHAEEVLEPRFGLGEGIGGREPVGKCVSRAKKAADATGEGFFPRKKEPRDGTGGRKEGEERVPL
jgi:hypothetical protein